VKELHEKINRHPKECPVLTDVEKLKLIEAGRASVFVLLMAIGGIVGGAAWSMLKGPICEWLKSVFGHGSTV